jgi:2-polyprenyl-3-methyl-5-hydroxy-6-metoxy-1,4-benzoquinol methylase
MFTSTLQCSSFHLNLSACRSEFDKPNTPANFECCMPIPVKQSNPEADPFLARMADRPIQAQRYLTLKSTLRGFQPLFSDQRVLDFGCAFGLSACAMVALGARSVIGVEPLADRVEEGKEILHEIGYSDRVSLQHVADTRKLPFRDGTFSVVIAIAVFEHIPQPREEYIAEVWRQVAPGGVLIVSETPNKYIPWDYHTTGLPLLNWLPKRLARVISLRTGRFATDDDWDHSGWRGLGYYEMMRSIGGPRTVTHERTRLRHSIFRAIGLPAALLDPYPIYVIRKA